MIENNKDSSIDISPVTEKSKRINKFVIMVIVFVIGALILYLVFDILFNAQVELGAYLLLTPPPFFHHLIIPPSN